MKKSEINNRLSGVFAKQAVANNESEKLRLGGLLNFSKKCLISSFYLQSINGNDFEYLFGFKLID